MNTHFLGVHAGPVCVEIPSHPGEGAHVLFSSWEGGMRIYITLADADACPRADHTASPQTGRF